MKSSFIKPHTPERSPTFPGLYRNKYSGDIALFIHSTNGAVVYEGSANPGKGNPLGTLLVYFPTCTGPWEWEYLPEGSKVVLTQ